MGGINYYKAQKTYTAYWWQVPVYSTGGKSALLRLCFEIAKQFHLMLKISFFYKAPNCMKATKFYSLVFAGSDFLL